MGATHAGARGSALGWLVFPLVPALLERFYYGIIFLGGDAHGVPDPRAWEPGTWALELGPLIGFAFLAGATLTLVDPIGRRGLVGWFSRRSVWVAVGPWLGFLFWAALFFADELTQMLFPAEPDQSRPVEIRIDGGEPGAWGGWASWLILGAFLVSLSYIWVFFAVAVLRRARRVGQAMRCFRRGLGFALAFLVTLFGGFWAVTAAWRSHFFDPRILQALLFAVALVCLSGCSSTITYGEHRRRELFEAMLAAWMVGLAFLWRWWARPRGGA